MIVCGWQSLSATHSDASYLKRWREMENQLVIEWGTTAAASTTIMQHWNLKFHIHSRIGVYIWNPLQIDKQSVFYNLVLVFPNEYCFGMVVEVTCYVK